MSGLPARPSISPVTWFALAMWTGCAAAEWAVWAVAAGRDGAILGSGAALGLLMAATAIFGRHGGAVRTIALMVSLGLVAGLCVSGMYGAAWMRQERMLANCGAREWTGTVEADPLPGSYGAVVRVRVTGGPLDGARVRIGWPDGVGTPDLGRVVRFSAIVKALPIEEPWARRAMRGGVCGTGTAWRAQTGRWRSGLTGSLYSWRAETLARMHPIPGPGGDLAEGIVLGDRRRLIGTTTEEDFRILGLTHLVAVSGSHLAMACAAVAFIGMALHLPRRWLIPMTLTAGAAYAVVTGLPFSALRSLLMLLVGGAGQMSGRRRDGVASLSVAAIGVLVVEPWAVFDLGFQLSALAVGGLLLFGSLATAWMTAGLKGPMRPMAGTLALTLVAQLTTVPVIASGFAMVSLMAPVANAVVGPLVSGALLLGLSGAVVGSVAPGVGAVASEAAAAVLGATAWLAGLLARVPGAAIAVRGGPLLALATCACAAGVWLWWPLPTHSDAGRRTVAIAACLTLLLAMGPAPVRQASVTVLDVGQADAILVRDGGRTMLVDAAADPLALRQALARTGTRVVDVLVLTHAHGDHTGGASGLTGIADVGWIGVSGAWEFDENPPGTARRPADPMPGNSKWRGPDAAVRPLTAGDSWRIGQTVVRVLWPPQECPGDLKTNDTSIVLHVSRGPFDMVLTGDAEESAQRGMMDVGALSNVEVLKVPHHGSTNGLTEDALEAWAPVVALISVGQGNDFGHPSPGTLDMLAAARVRTLRTDTHGDLTVEIGRTGYRATSSRRGSGSGVRARMSPTRPAARDVVAASCAFDPKGSRGCQYHRGTETGLSDLRRRGALARPRAPPPA